MKSFDENFEDGLSDPSKYILKFTFEAGQQSKQAEVDELRKRIDEALNVMCKLQYSSGERIYDEVGKILKGNTNEH